MHDPQYRAAVAVWQGCMRALVVHVPKLIVGQLRTGFGATLALDLFGSATKCQRRNGFPKTIPVSRYRFGLRCTPGAARPRREMVVATTPRRPTG